MRWAARLLAVLTLAVTSTHTANATEALSLEGDWVSIRVMADSEVTDLSVRVITDVAYEGDLATAGFGLRTPSGSAIAVYALSRATSVETLGFAGGPVNYTFAEPGSRRVEMLTTLHVERLTTGQEAELLVFVPGASASHAVVNQTSSGSITTITLGGRGSQAIRSVPAGGGGRGVGTPVVSAGDVTTRRGPKSAIVGGLAQCNACVVKIRHGSDVVSDGPTNAVPLFAGPAGDWRFRWTGADINEPAGVLAGYAPVGPEITARWLSNPQPP